MQSPPPSEPAATAAAPSASDSFVLIRTPPRVKSPSTTGGTPPAPLSAGRSSAKSPAPAASGTVSSVEDVSVVIEALMQSQSRARESERLVQTYDEKLLAAIQRIQSYVQEAQEQLVSQAAQVRALEAELRDATHDSDTESIVLLSIEKSLQQAREQQALDEMELERRKILLRSVDQFVEPVLLWRSSSFDGQQLRSEIKARTSTDLIPLAPSANIRTGDESVLLAGTAAAAAASSSSSSSSAAPHSVQTSALPLPLPAPAPASSPSRPAPVISVVLADSQPQQQQRQQPPGPQLDAALRRITELESALQRTEARAKQAEEDRLCSELRLQQLLEALESDQRSSQTMRETVRQKQLVTATSGSSRGGAVVPPVDQRLQLLHAEVQKTLYSVVQSVVWLLAWLLPVSTGNDLTGEP